ncbi:MAG: acetyl-CoA carboxylase biotin carboxyl carrier protein [Betaproteobacteria bacterium]|nr:acetyl-CoA carboxylase biotin carboxyl carrier protein [Betaproteobacteria bacterium]
MDLRKLKTLIDLVAESSISELEITEGEGKVRIVKASAPQAQTAAPVAAVVPMAAPIPAPVVASAPGPSLAVDQPVVPAAGHSVSSPMVGTFYRASSPGSSPFVSLGDSVTEGQTLCVIEAMKLMNEIPADRAGVVKEILAENGQAVEFGQPLFVIG